MLGQKEEYIEYIVVQNEFVKFKLFLIHHLIYDCLKFVGSIE